MKFELEGKCYPSKQIIIFCAVWCSIGISKIYLSCKRRRRIFYPQALLQPTDSSLGLCRRCSVTDTLADKWTQRCGNANTQVFSPIEKNADTWCFEAYPPEAPVYSLYNNCSNLTLPLCHCTLQGLFLTVPAHGHCSRKPHIVLP